MNTLKESSIVTELSRFTVTKMIFYLPSCTSPQFAFCRNKQRHWLNDSMNEVIYQYGPDPMVLLSSPCNLLTHNIATIKYTKKKKGDTITKDISLTIHYFDHKWLRRIATSKRMQIATYSQGNTIHDNGFISQCNYFLQLFNVYS